MKLKEILSKIKFYDWEQYRKDHPKGMIVSVNGHKVPPRTEGEKEKFAQTLVAIEKEGPFLDMMDYIFDCRFPNYQFVNN